MFYVPLQVLVACVSLLSGLFFPSSGIARITKIEVQRVESPTFEGREFGNVGQYEKISGRLFGEVDPSAVENVGIVNLDKAPKNPAGRVAYSTDFVIMVTNTASEYWRKSASLLHTDTLGNDVPTPDNVRLYFFASTQHFALYAPPIATSLGQRLVKGPCEHEHNPAFRGPVMRALLTALHSWVYQDTPPPVSQIPTRQAGTLVSAEESVKGFPRILGVTHIAHPNPTRVKNKVGAEAQYTSLVPKTDAGRNDLAGIRLPDIAALLGTHTGWAVRADVPVKMREMCSNWGQFVPFAKTKTEREKTGDPRRSLAERYPTKQAYVEKIEQTVYALH